MASQIHYLNISHRIDLRILCNYAPSIVMAFGGILLFGLRASLWYGTTSSFRHGRKDDDSFGAFISVP
jgi:hypothetical protein